MVADMGYWTKTLKRVLFVAVVILALFASVKLLSFYWPFLIAFIISLIVEPIIKVFMKKLKFSRRLSAIIALGIVLILLGLILFFGISRLVQEASKLTQGLNLYFDNIYMYVTGIMDKLDGMQIPDQIVEVSQNSIREFLGTLALRINSLLMGVVQIIGSIPRIGVYIIVTFLATVFMCVDKIYILDQMEHHLPGAWVKEITTHAKEIFVTLGSYLKAQLILILISFIEVLAGLSLMSMIGLNVEYPILAAILIGFVDALPILGSGTVLIPWAIVSALSGDITLAIALVILYVTVIVIRQLIEPKIVSKEIGIHPIFTLIAMYTGFKFIGLMGLLAGPIVLIILKNIFSTMLEKGVFKVMFDKK